MLHYAVQMNPQVRTPNHPGLLPGIILLLLSILPLSAAAERPFPLEGPFDLAIVNGTVIDGTGSPPLEADIGIVKDMIVYLGTNRKIDAAEVIDAEGLFVTPGFIDIHTHSEDSILEIPTADNYLLQGVTTLIAGNCGASSFPSPSFSIGSKIREQRSTSEV